MNSSVRKYMCVLCVTGTYRKTILHRRRKFIAYFYFTPVKRRIIDHHLEGVTADLLGLGAFIGHGVEEIEAKLVDRGFEIYRIER